ncbi:MAG: hypothetical protein PHV61_01235 [Limnochordia bacterium]|jgi:hypothetical protein|nr:hypothetical protein [Limnochordia bacterium]MDD2628784.1 hypothetical protein [Limnochordia bacterium]MDD4517526.1 hypothetical protein [Limnochordia bacterium]
MWRYQQVPYQGYAQPWSYRGYNYPCGCTGAPAASYHSHESTLQALRAHEAALLEGLKAVRGAIEEMEALVEQKEAKAADSQPEKD